MTIWRLAWRSALRRRRLFIWNVAVPLLLLTPVASSEAAAPHRVAVFGVFLVFFGAFGSSIPAVRDARDGWLDEVFRSGYPAGRWLLERTVAEMCIDVLQTFPAVLALLWFAGGMSKLGVVLAGLGLALLFANLLGPVIAALVRSLAEAALACAAVSLSLLHFAGFFRRPAPGPSELVATWNPYTPLRLGLEAAVSDAPIVASAWLAPSVTIAVAGLAIVVTTSGWSRRLRWPWNG
ncbi:MAG: ABC transporter permease [Gemmatimonadetes bacterium]|nr:ABC transporter permease [Gemmatimonadota bacterium]